MVPKHYLLTSWKYFAAAKFILPKKQSVVLWKRCKSIYVKEVIKHSKTSFSNKTILENSNKFPALYLQPVNLKVLLKLSGKNVSYYITRILSMEGLHLCNKQSHIQLSETKYQIFETKSSFFVLRWVDDDL